MVICVFKQKTAYEMRISDWSSDVCSSDLGDGILQLGEFKIAADAIVLATPEIAGLPYVIAGLVAAGGLAAALSTADGLLLAIANALSHDKIGRGSCRDRVRNTE